MTAQTLTLTDFLLARIAEDEALVEGIGGGSDDPDFFWGPDRIRDECEAKRQVLLIWEACQMRGTLLEKIVGPSIATAVEECVRALALLYADHPDYDEAWRP